MIPEKLPIGFYLVFWLFISKSGKSDDFSHFLHSFIRAFGKRERHARAISDKTQMGKSYGKVTRVSNKWERVTEKINFKND
jgi:hypothetical protein